MIRKLVAGSFAALCLALSGGTQAAIVDGSNSTFSFSWNYDTGSSNLTGFGSMSVSGFESNMLLLTVSLTNTSVLGGQGGERLTSFGFGIDPDADWVLFSDTADEGMVDAVLGQTFPSIKTVEVCAFGKDSGNGDSCAGGSNGGIFGDGGNDMFSILLGGNWGKSVTIEPLAFKYQTGYGSYEFTDKPPSRVPEPSSGLLLLLGFGLLVAGSAFKYGVGRASLVHA